MCGFARATAGLAGTTSRAADTAEQGGLAGQFAAGALLGLVWSPCIGPALGGAIALASQGESLLQAFSIMAFFAAGAASIALGLAYGSRELIARRRQTLMTVSRYAKPVMGAALIAVGLAIWFHLDQVLEGLALEYLPAWFTDLSVSI
jgi:cytochrome c biogenesis protein CcdA